MNVQSGRAYATTIVAVRRNGLTAMAGDGQVTMGDTVMKHTARKLRRLSGGRVLAGFAGSVADAISLFDKFETQLDRFGGNIRKAAVELTKDWRTDRILRRLEAQLLVADQQTLLLLARGWGGDRTRRRCAGHWLRRPIRAGGRRVRWLPTRRCSAEPHRPVGDGDRRRALHLHQFQHRARHRRPE